jgi:hypothetical protein
MPLTHEEFMQEKDSRISTIREILSGKSEDVGSLSEYALWFEYVPEGTFNGQKEAYFCWLLSFGGPEDEFRFYPNPSLSVGRVTYAYLEAWTEKLEETLTGEDEATLLLVWERELSGQAEEAYRKAVQRDKED